MNRSTQPLPLDSRWASSDKGRTRFNAKEFQLVLKRMRNALTSVIASQCRAIRGVAVVPFARRTSRLSNGVDRFMTRATLSQSFPHAHAIEGMICGALAARKSSRH